MKYGEGNTMNARGLLVRACIVGILLAVAGGGALLMQVPEAHAYTYTKTNSSVINNRLWIRAYPADDHYAAWIEIAGADPNGPSYWMPSGTGDSSWNGRVSYWGVGLWKASPDNLNGNYTSTTTGNTKWIQGAYLGGSRKALGDASKSAYINHHSANGGANGVGLGCIATYGWRSWAYLSDLQTGGGEVGLDSLLGAETWISNDFADSSERVGHYFSYTYFWPRVSIQYDANGGSGAPGSHYKYMGASANVSTTKPTRTGYTFEGWSLKKSGPVQIASNQFIGCTDWNLFHPFYVPAHYSWEYGPTGFYRNTAYGLTSPTGSNTITLYAQWKPIAYTVVYDGNGATGGATASSSHIYDATQSLTANGFSRSYSLKLDAQGGSAGTKTLPCRWAWTSWNTALGATGTSYADKARLKNLRSTAGRETLYAQWNPGFVVLPDPGSKKNSTFEGWFTAAQGGSLVGQPGESVSISANTTYYAQWEEQARISYYVDGEHTPTFSETVVVGAAYSTNPRAADQGAKEGCAGFDAWYTDKACTQRYVDGSTVVAPELSLFGRNEVSVTYEFADQSRTLLEGRELFFDEELHTALALEQMLPDAQVFHYGDRIVFARGRRAWFSTHARAREATCAVGAYATADASGAPSRAIRLTQNTTAYLLWRIPAYDGISLS